MPRPDDMPQANVRKALVVAAVVAVIVVAGLVASCSMAEDTSGRDQDQGEALPGQVASEEGAAANADATSDAKDAKVGGLSKLGFLGKDGKAGFVSALREYMTENDLGWPSGAEVRAVRNQTDTTARVFVSLDGGAWLVCYWVKDTSTPFLFEATTKEEAESTDDDTDASGSDAVTQPADPSTSEPVTGDTTDGNVSDDTGTSQTSTAAGVASSRAGSSGTSSGSQTDTSSSSSSGQARDAKSASSGKATAKREAKDARRRDIAKRPVLASDADALERKLPEEAALTLPTAIGNYMAKHGSKVDGKTATIDLASVRKTKKGLSFYGYVTDAKGRVHYLDAEWNVKKRQFGMATYR